MKYLFWGLTTLLIALAATLIFSSRAEFIAGGALVNLGFRLQDPLESFDLEAEHGLRPERVFERLLAQNALAASVRTRFPRSARHPLVAMVVCMDARIDTNELVGDTRKYYYVIRTAGSVLAPKEQDMLQLAVENGVELILLTTHTNCAAEKAARDPAMRLRYPDLVRAVDERAKRDAELLQRPALAARIAKSELAIRHVHIDTNTAHMTQVKPPPQR